MNVQLTPLLAMKTMATDSELDFDVKAFFQTLVPKAFPDMLLQIQLWEVNLYINELKIFLSYKEKKSHLTF